MKKFASRAIIIIAILFLFLTWFESTYSMDEAKAFEVNSKELNHKVLIGTQGSEFKGSIVKKVCAYFADSVYFKIIDVKDLKSMKPADWNAVIILYTNEIFSPEENAATFAKNNQDSKNTFYISTSGTGNALLEGVDGIATVSKPSSAKGIASEIIEKISLQLK